MDFGKAIELAYRSIDDYNEKLLNLREYYISSIEKKIDDIYINGSRKDRLPGNANISFKGVDGNTLLLKLDQYGICTSTGSACNSGSTEPSHVLLAIRNANRIYKWFTKSNFWRREYKR